MATLYVTEYRKSVLFYTNTDVQVVQTPAVASQAFTFSTSTQSAAFSAQTNIVRIHTDATCAIAFGSNPTATAASGGTGSPRLVAGQTEYFGVNPGDKVAVLAVS